MCLLELILSIGCFACFFGVQHRSRPLSDQAPTHTDVSLYMAELEVYLRQPTRTDVCTPPIRKIYQFTQYTRLIWVLFVTYSEESCCSNCLYCCFFFCYGCDLNIFRYIDWIFFPRIFTITWRLVSTLTCD